ncbi:hypothetical protein JCM11491_003222 [Sporobolomyces phaffii]
MPPPTSGPEAEAAAAASRIALAVLCKLSHTGVTNDEGRRYFSAYGREKTTIAYEPRTTLSQRCHCERHHATKGA